MKKSNGELVQGQAVEVVGADGGIIFTGTLTYFRGHWVGVASEGEQAVFLAHWVRAARLSVGAESFYGRLE